jgi:hypothetical protein
MAFDKISRIYRTIKILSRWFNFEAAESKCEGREILKPLNKLIDFEAKELIYNNNFGF